MNRLKPRKALNKAFLKVKPNRTAIERFKSNLIELLDRTNDTESEEFHKNLVSDFLKKTYYEPNHYINTKGRNDLVIHNGDKAKSSVGVILEAKKPTNRSEMLSVNNLNRKAFQELVLYYLRERITQKNLEVKHLVITNITEWFIFDATTFDRIFAQNKNLVKQFTDFEAGRLADTKTDFFYRQVAEPFIADLASEIEFTYFNLQEYQKPLRNADKADDNKLIALFKLLSPEHLLKLPFTNDSNSLDKRFYTELLHIIGLDETKEGGKKLINRNKEGNRNSGSILEDAIIQLDSLDKIGRLDRPSQFGAMHEERLFNVGLELSITWINRILFLKLLEAQLLTYQNASRTGGSQDNSHAFLNLDKIKNYDDLNSLFFQVLAKKPEERNQDVKDLFEKVPYLNSSLFEPTEIEHSTLFISNLRDDKAIPIISSTVLKNDQGKKRTGKLPTLEYLFEFLNAYDFSSEGSEEIQEDNKILINASVLGLIFEKINGYKDGSFFTPGFITMYMCRETIRKSVVQKFNEALSSFSSTKKADTGKNKIELQGKKVDPKVLEFARNNRKDATESEAFLWEVLRNRKLNGLKFRRQHPIEDTYVLDFYCAEQRLAVELDGGYHTALDQKEYDEGRTYALNELGLTVLRFTNQEVLGETERVLQAIFNATLTPRPPLPKGEGEKVPSGEMEQVPSPSGRGDLGVRELRLNNLDDVYDLIGPGGVFTYQAANDIVNSIKICDPAVGSGHFLVSALNEMIAVKNDLKILQDRNGRRLKEYQVEVVNDELIVTDEEGELFEYNPTNKETQRIQETLFHEKQTIIENCLFGVDINPNSVKICRLRLWIELLKSAYYKTLTALPKGEGERGESKQVPSPMGRGDLGVREMRELETLPNIDINIKCGNSLVSRFPIDADLGQALKKSKWSIDSYRMAVSTYRNAQNKEEKREMERLILEIKQSFSSSITMNNPLKKKLDKLASELYHRFTGTFLFEPESDYGGKRIETKRKKEQEKLEKEIEKLSKKIDDIKESKIYNGSFEWRFEFPEVLNDEGTFEGFDLIIGNPPYIRIQDLKNSEIDFVEYLNKTYESTGKGNYDIYIPFIELGYKLLKNKGQLSFIMPHKFLNANYGSAIRNFLSEKTFPKKIIHFGSSQVFEDATTYTGIFFMSKNKNEVIEFINWSTPSEILSLDDSKLCRIRYESLCINGWEFLNQPESQLMNTLKKSGINLESVTERIFQGLKTSADKIFIVKKLSETKTTYLVFSEIQNSQFELEKSFLFPLIKGGNSRPFKILETELLIVFPYKGGKLVSIDTLKEMSPKTYHYLSLNKVYLESRENQKFKGNHWYQYGRNQAIDVIKNLKIFTPDLAPSPRFSFDEKGEFMFTGGASGGYGIVPNDKVSHYFLLGILNSKISEWFIRLTSTQMRGGWLSYESRYIKNIPMPSQLESMKLENLVKKALEQEILNNELKNQIDQLVYELYGLTEDEIAIVEGKEIIHVAEQNN